MISVQNVKTVAMEPASYTAGSTASVVIDTLGCNYASIIVNLAHATNATLVPTVLEVDSSDVTNASSFSLVTSLTSTFLTASTNSGTPDNLGFFLSSGGTGFKRYLKVLVSPTCPQVVSVNAILSRQEQSPWSGTAATASTTFGLSVAPAIL